MANGDRISVPTSGKLKGNAMAYGYGAAGALIMGMLSKFLGNSTLANVGTTIIGAAVLPETEGKILSTIMGYNLINSGSFSLSGLTGGSKTSSEATI
jgi:hypothetical protein